MTTKVKFQKGVALLGDEEDRTISLVTQIYNWLSVPKEHRYF